MRAGSPPRSTLTVFSPSTTTQLRARTTWVTIPCFPASFPVSTWTCTGWGWGGQRGLPHPLTPGFVPRAHRVTAEHLPILSADGFHEDLLAALPRGVPEAFGCGAGPPGAVPVTLGQLRRGCQAQESRKAHGARAGGTGQGSYPQRRPPHQTPPKPPSGPPAPQRPPGAASLSPPLTRCIPEAAAIGRSDHVGGRAGHAGSCSSSRLPRPPLPHRRSRTEGLEWSSSGQSSCEPTSAYGAGAWPRLRFLLQLPGGQGGSPGPPSPPTSFSPPISFSPLPAVSKFASIPICASFRSSGTKHTK